MDTFLVSEDTKPCSIRNFLAQKGISLTNWRKIKKDGTNENREKRLSDWTIREDRATKRLEKEFKKK